jgi:hypothetical protein
VSGTPAPRAHAGLGSDPAQCPPREGSGRPVAGAPAPDGRPEVCPHAPPCPPPETPGRLAARVIVSHPGQGWSLLCNAVVLFHDTGALLPDGSVIEPDTGMSEPRHPVTARLPGELPGVKAAVTEFCPAPSRKWPPSRTRSIVRRISHRRRHRPPRGSGVGDDAVCE